jgi:hypothetical protein
VEGAKVQGHAFGVALPNYYGTKWGCQGFASQAEPQDVLAALGHGTLQVDQIQMERAIARVSLHATMDRTGLAPLTLQ